MRYMMLVAALAAASCGPQPTKAIGATQRVTPFFRVLVYERVQKGSSGADVDVLVLEDAAGNCWITSGQDGGVVAAPPTSCAAAQAPENEPARETPLEQPRPGDPRGPR